MYHAINTFIESYEKNNRPDYDYIIITRFDLMFKKKLSDLSLIKNKFMISCICDNPNLCDDNFFVTNIHKLYIFRDILKEYLTNDKCMHSIYNNLLKIFNNDLKILIKGNFYFRWNSTL